MTETIIDRIRAFTLSPDAELSPKYLISLQEARDLLRDYDYLRRLAGAVSAGPPFKEIRASGWKPYPVTTPISGE